MASQEDSLISRLCEDLIVDILRRLTDKEIIRCKCLSKEWYKIISHVCVPKLSIEAPVSGLYFRLVRVSKEVSTVTTNSSLDRVKELLEQVAHCYTDHFIGCAPLELKGTPKPSTNNNLISNGEVGLSGMSYESLLPFKSNGSDFLDSCNGLLLFVERPKPWYYVCNPAIRECVPIPLPPPSIHLSSLYASLAFDPSESIHYRVVISSLNSRPQCFHVFYSEFGEWRTHEVQIELPASAHRFLLIRHCVYLKGVLYRLSLLNKVVRYDLNALKVSAINSPNSRFQCPRGCLGVLNGCLAYAKEEDNCVRIWLLENPSDDQWSLKYEIPFNFLLKELAEMELFSRFVWMHPYGFHPKSDIIFLGTARLLAVYHLRTQRCEIVQKNKYHGDMHAGRYYSIFTYSRTLVTLKNWCRGTAELNNDVSEVYDDCCFAEQ